MLSQRGIEIRGEKTCQTQVRSQQSTMRGCFGGTGGKALIRQRLGSNAPNARKFVFFYRNYLMLSLF